MTARIARKSGDPQLWVWDVKTGAVLLRDGDTLQARFLHGRLVYTMRDRGFRLFIVSAKTAGGKAKRIRVASPTSELQGDRVVCIARESGHSALTSADAPLTNPSVLYRFRRGF